MPLLLLLLTISVLQWVVVLLIIEFADLVNINFDPTMVLYGNLQLIILIVIYNFIKKYIRV